MQPFRVAVLHYKPSSEPIDPVVPQILKSLQAGGHEAVAIDVDESVQDMLKKIERAKADLVFNICETFAEDYRMEVNVAALMELARIPFTGSGTTGLLLAQDKILTKQLLQYHGVLTPKFATFDDVAFETNGGLSFPLIVKPAKSDASIGLEIVRDLEGLAKTVKKIRREFDDDALAEEFVEGREIYVGVIGDHKKPRVLPTIELDFGKGWKKGHPRIANRDVKFGPETEGSPRLHIPKDLTDELRGRIERAAVLAYRALKLRDYARIDFRIAQSTNEPYLLEANPNPYLEATCEVAMGAKERGVDYDALINGIVESAARRFGLHKKLAKEARELAAREAEKAAAKEPPKEPVPAKDAPTVVPSK